jgi:polysaccharide biosynthesis/export protein
MKLFKSHRSLPGAARPIALGLVLAAAGFVVPPASLSAQVPQDTAEIRRMVEQRLGPGVTQQDLLRQLQQSGMTRSQVRIRLQQMGYDARLADQYFDALERGRELDPTQRPSQELVDAMERMGLELRLPQDSLLLMADSLMVDSLLKAAERTRIFGKTLFARSTGEFEPLAMGPVSRDYRLGPGDEVWLILTGDVELSYPLNVTREGFLIIPQVGQVPVNGLTLGQLEERLFIHLGRAYSGVRRGPEATTHFQVSLGQLRPNQVYVVGEVERPSGYRISPMARVFNALYRAGGPNEVGSFRQIHVRRDGRVVAEVDLYPYLLGGEAARDVRLENGDMVFVPLAGPRVTVEGAVRRPGIYEIKPGEGLADVLWFAGGVRPEAVLQRVQIDRILHIGERAPGKERALIDVDVASLVAGGGTLVPLRDGDIVTLFTVSEERRNRVAVMGGVRRPGQYEWRPGMTLAELVARADGLDEGAYVHRALIYRLQQDRTRHLLRAPLEGPDPERLVLADRDSVVVLREDSLRLPLTVGIHGFVKEPGDYPLAHGMTVRDLVLAAGGFAEGAFVESAEVARSVDPLTRTSHTARVYDVRLADTRPDNPASGSSRVPDGVPRWHAEADEFVLQRNDRVYVRRAPGFGEARSVTVTGQVLMPGDYELDARDTRISDVISRAGGLTSEAYPDGFSVTRGGRVVAGNLTRALSDPSSSGNILLEPGDTLHVPQYDGTVNVTGAVQLEAMVLYDPRRSLRDYIERAGGFAENANRRGVMITYANGERRVVNRTLLFTRYPPVGPGSTIHVPALAPAEMQGVNWGEVITRTTALMTAFATLYLALNR